MLTRVRSIPQIGVLWLPEGGSFDKIPPAFEVEYCGSLQGGCPCGKEIPIVQERRSTVRRATDREFYQRYQQMMEYGQHLQARVQQLQALLEQRAATPQQPPPSPQSDGVQAGNQELERQRRRTIRHNCEVSIEMLIGYSSGYSDDWSVDSVKVKGKILDLSSGGASLFTGHRFETGQELRLMIRLRDKTEISAHAKVRWVKDMVEKNGFVSGVQFTKLGEKDQAKVSKFLAELDATAGF